MELGQKGFTTCGVYYVMDDYKQSYIDYLKELLKEIKQNAKR